MDIIVEGPDGSGKSTLVKAIADLSGAHIIGGRGPERYPGEMEVRAQEYLDDMERRIKNKRHSFTAVYDRHPCVSHPIYSRFTNVSTISPNTIHRFYQLPIFLVYCEGFSELPDDHQTKAYDTPEHLKAIKDNHTKILEAYHQWALLRAHLKLKFRAYSPTEAAKIAIHGRDQLKSVWK